MNHTHKELPFPVGFYETFCPSCGALEGQTTFGCVYKAPLPDTRLLYASKERRQAAEETLVRQGILAVIGTLQWEEVPTTEKIPAPAKCSACEVQAKQWLQEVENGGVFFTCTQCSISGVINSDSTYASIVRQHQSTPVPGLLRILFDKCEQHRGLEFVKNEGVYNN